MNIDGDFRQRVIDHQEASKDAQRAVHLNRVVTTAIDGFRGRAKARTFEFFSDEPKEGGGDNTAPRPLEYLLAGFAFCQQAQYAKHAALRDLDITGLKMDVKGYVDQRGVLGVDGVAAGFRNIEYKVVVDSPESVATIRQLADLVDSVCPAHAAMSGCTPLHRVLVLNGAEIKESEPGLQDVSVQR